MKILLANKFFFLNGGSEAVMFAEREFLRGADIEVVEFSMQDRRNLPSRYADYFVGSRSYADGGGGALGALRQGLGLIHSAEAVRKIGALIDCTRPDLVHCHNIYHQLTPSIIGAAKRRGVPVVLTLHDYKPICPVYTCLRGGELCTACAGGRTVELLRHRCAEGSLARSALLYLEARVQRLLGSYEQLDAVIAPSEFMRNAVTRARFAPERVRVIHNGIDTGAIPPPGEDDQGYALYFGRLSREKGIETLLAAHAAIADRLPLRIAGTGPLAGALRERYPHAEFLGHLAGEQLAETVRGAAFVVVPSQWYENCPMSVLEAMAHGKAVVASDIGGLPELVVHGQSGLLFPAGDREALGRCLLHLAENREARRRLGAAGRERVERRFTLARHNIELLRLYVEVIEAVRGGASLAVFPNATREKEQ